MKNDVSTQAQNENCHYFYSPESDTHHIIYQTVGRMAVDAFLSHFNIMLRDAPSDGVIRLIVDNHVNDEPQPLNYMVARIRSFLKVYPKRASVRVAIVHYKRNPLFALIDMIFRSMRRGNDHLRYFKHEDWDAMMDWLQADD